jgi:beta-glucosidase
LIKLTIEEVRKEPGNRMRTAMLTYQYPPGFVWGVATASAQIEGAAREDGKGESIWDRFSTLPDKIKGGDTPEGACDHYHRYEADADLMRELGIRHYRLVAPGQL